MKKITTILLLFVASVTCLNAVTTQNTECKGTDTQASQGSFATGYNYEFTTNGTDLTVTFELLDTKDGVVAYAWTYNPNFAETGMTNVGGKKFSKTFTGQTIGTTFKVGCKFAFAGGMAVTKTFEYVVGNSCGSSTDTEIPSNFTATSGTVTPSSIELLLNATDNSGAIAYTITYGTTTLTTSGNSGVQKSYVVTGLTPSTDYTFSVAAKDAAGNLASNNPITVNATTTAAADPLTAAPTPTRPANRVVSIFSDTYENAAGATEFNPNWGQATSVSTIQIEGNNTLKYATLNYQGTAFGNHVNAADMLYMHIDVFTEDETMLQITPISPGHELLYTLPTLTLNTWNSYDIPLSSFTGVDLSDLFQIKVVGSGGKTVYLDNIYFYTDAPADTEIPTAFTATKGLIASDAVEFILNATDNSGAVFFEITYNSTTVKVAGVSGVEKSYTISGLTSSTDYTFSVAAKDRTGNSATNNPIVLTATTLSEMPAAPVPTVEASKVISIFSDTYTNVSGTNFNPGWGQSTVVTTSSISGNAVMKYANFGYQGIELGSHVDANAMNKLHIDIFPTTETSIWLTPISPGKEISTSLGTLTAGVWNSIDVPLATYTGVVLSDLIQFKFDHGTGGTFYMDNLYLYNDDFSGIIIPEESNTIYCYPNPVNDILTINSKNVINQARICNLLGQTIKVIPVNGLNKSIDLTDLSSGNYFVSLLLNNGVIETRKIVKL